MELAVNALREKKNIDLLFPYIDNNSNNNNNNNNNNRGKGELLENYYELSMREALRCDLRNGSVTTTTRTTTTTTTTTNEDSLRLHPAVFRLLLLVF